MRRIDLHEITIKYPGALEWFDTACPRFTEIVTRFYERGIPYGHPADVERSRASVELVAVATPERAHADGSGNLFTTDPIEARWLASFQIWVRYSNTRYAWVEGHENTALCHATLPALTTFMAPRDVVYLHDDGIVSHDLSTSGMVPRIGTLVGRVYVRDKVKLARVELTRDGVRELKRRSLPYDRPADDATVEVSLHGRPPCRARRGSHAGCHACRGTGIAPSS